MMFITKEILLTGDNIWKGGKGKPGKTRSLGYDRKKGEKGG